NPRSAARAGARNFPPCAPPTLTEARPAMSLATTPCRVTRRPGRRSPPAPPRPLPGPGPAMSLATTPCRVTPRAGRARSAVPPPCCRGSADASRRSGGREDVLRPRGGAHHGGEPDRREREADGVADGVGAHARLEGPPRVSMDAT